MPSFDDFKGRTPAWCPGCGNFMILKTLKDALVEIGLAPHRFTIVSGIGQAAKLPHYLRCNTFNGLHGRTLPVATGLKLADHGLEVLVTTGDGDCYGEGGNHFMHAIRRNIGLKLFVHNNQIYGLTKGQASPTSMEGMKTKNQPLGVFSRRFNPLALAIALDCGFVARGFCGDMPHLKGLILEAIRHEGFALIDILQNCVTFNKLNTIDWYRSRVYRLEATHDPGDKYAAFQRAQEWEEKIPLGVLYRNDRPAYEKMLPMIRNETLVTQRFDSAKAAEIIKEFL